MLKVTAEVSQGEQPRIFWEDDTTDPAEILELVAKLITALNERAKTKITDLFIEEIMEKLDPEEERIMRLSIIEDPVFAENLRESVWAMLAVAEKLSKRKGDA